MHLLRLSMKPCKKALGNLCATCFALFLEASDMKHAQAGRKTWHDGASGGAVTFPSCFGGAAKPVPKKERVARSASLL